MDQGKGFYQKVCSLPGFLAANDNQTELFRGQADLTSCQLANLEFCQARGENPANMRRPCRR